MSTRIRWAEPEKLAVATAVVEYIKLFPKASMVKAIGEAQYVLSENRRRAITSKTEIPWITRYMEHVKLAPSIDSLFNGDTIVELAPPVETPSATISPPTPPEIPQPATLDLMSMPLPALIDTVAGRIFNELFKPKLDEMCESYLAQKAATMIEQIQVMRGEKGRVQVVVPETVKRLMRPKVLILGLLGKQVTEIKQTYGKSLDLTLVGSDHKHDGLIGLAKSHDVGIVMTRFVNHGQQAQVRDNAPHTIMVSGATSDLSNILHSLVTHGQDSVKHHNFASKSFIAA